MLLDASVDRVEERAESDFERAVTAVRVGYVTARDRKAARSWDRRSAKRHGASLGLSGAALESAIGALAATHPEYVVNG
jgi:hypothetical protein